MHSFFVILLAILCISMFFVRREIKLGILFFACICLYEYELPIMFGNCVQILPICFFLSERKNMISQMRANKNNVLAIIFSLAVFYVVVTIINSPYLQIGRAPITYIINQMLSRYFLLLSALMCIHNQKDLMLLFRLILVSVIIMSIFALWNFITVHSVYVDWLFQGKKVADYLEDAGNMYSNSSRFRVQGTFHNAFDYGYTCLACLLLFLYGRSIHVVKKSHFLIVLFCTLFGIVTCGCRTLLITSLISLMVYGFVYYNIRRYLMYIGIFLIFFLFLSNFIPGIDYMYTSVLSVFSNDTNIQGSSIDMRLLQFYSVMGYVQDHLLYGRGVGFFANDLGFAGGRAGLVDKSLFGMEGSYLMSILETGFVGTILYFGIIAIFLWWSFSLIKTNRKNACLLLSVIIAFLVFGLLTGELRSAFITFLIAGIAICNIKTNIV